MRKIDEVHQLALEKAREVYGDDARLIIIALDSTSKNAGSVEVATNIEPKATAALLTELGEKFASLKMSKVKNA